MTEREGRPGIHDCGGEAAAYVLGSLAPSEAQAFREHLEGCAVCRDEVETLTGVVGALAMAAPQQPVPKQLRRRVMRAIRVEQRPRRRRRPPVVLTGARRRHRHAIGALGAAVIVALAIVAGLQLGGGARVIQARVTGISGSAQLLLSGGRGELIVDHLSPPPPSEVYEVWLAAPNAAPSPAGVLFSVSSSGRADLTIPENLRGISRVMVTLEPAGGTHVPTHAPVIVASL